MSKGVKDYYKQPLTWQGSGGREISYVMVGRLTKLLTILSLKEVNILTLTNMYLFAKRHT